MTTCRLVVLTPSEKTFDKHHVADGRVIAQLDVDAPGVFL